MVKYTYRVLVHGNFQQTIMCSTSDRVCSAAICWSGKALSRLLKSLDGPHGIKSVECVFLGATRTRNNQEGWISTLQITPHLSITQASSSQTGPTPPTIHRQLRSLLHTLNHPVIGNSEFCKTLKSEKALYFYLSKISFDHPVTGVPIVFEAPEQTKFIKLKAKDACAWEAKRQEELALLGKFREVDGGEEEEEADLLDTTHAAYLAGRALFHGIKFIVTPAVMVPRPATECLVDEVIRLFPDPATPLNILDLGCGSCCILLSLMAYYKNATGVGLDISQEALAVARQNADLVLDKARRQLEGSFSLVCGSFAEFPQYIHGKSSFDVIISNPPYLIPSTSRGFETKIVNGEPSVALFASGLTGFEAYDQIISGYLSASHSSAAPSVKPIHEIKDVGSGGCGGGGIMILEVKHGKAEVLRKRLSDKLHGSSLLTFSHTVRDQRGLERAIVFFQK